METVEDVIRSEIRKVCNEFDMALNTEAVRCQIRDAMLGVLRGKLRGWEDINLEAVASNDMSTVNIVPYYKGKQIKVYKNCFDGEEISESMDIIQAILLAIRTDFSKIYI